MNLLSTCSMRSCMIQLRRCLFQKNQKSMLNAQSTCLRNSRLTTRLALGQAMGVHYGIFNIFVLHADSEVLVESFPNYVRKPCLELWDRFQETFHDYSSLVQNSCIDLYTHQIRDLGGEIEQPFTFQNFTNQIEQLIHDYPDYFSPADDWNFGRLRNFSELNELVS